MFLGARAVSNLDAGAGVLVVVVAQAESRGRRMKDKKEGGRKFPSRTKISDCVALTSSW
jgi:hypothetical protein